MPGGRLEQAEAEGVDLLVGDVLLAGELLGDRVAALGRGGRTARAPDRRRGWRAGCPGRRPRGRARARKKRWSSSIAASRSAASAAAACRAPNASTGLPALRSRRARSNSSSTWRCGRDVGEQLGEHALERAIGRPSPCRGRSRWLARRARPAPRSPALDTWPRCARRRRRSGARPPARSRASSARASGSTASGALARPRAAASRAVGSSPPSASISALTADAPPPAGSRSIASFCAAAFFDFASAANGLASRSGIRAPRRVSTAACATARSLAVGVRRSAPRSPSRCPSPRCAATIRRSAAIAASRIARGDPRGVGDAAAASDDGRAR